MARTVFYTMTDGESFPDAELREEKALGARKTTIESAEREKEQQIKALRSLHSLFGKGTIWRASAEDGGRQKCAAPPSPLASTSGFGIPEIDCEVPFLPGTIHEFLSTHSSHIAPAGREQRPNYFPPCSIVSLLAANALKASSIFQQQRKPMPAVLWIGKSIWPNPHLLRRIRVGQASLLDYSLFLDTPPSAARLKAPQKKGSRASKKAQVPCTLDVWATLKALRSSAVAVIIASCDAKEDLVLKRLALVASRSSVVSFLLRHTDTAASRLFSNSRWLVTPKRSGSERPLWELELLKVRGRQPLTHSWQIEFFDSFFSFPLQPHTASAQPDDCLRDIAYEELSLRLSSDVVSESRLEAPSEERRRRYA
jgi:hypothetical protein